MASSTIALSRDATHIGALLDLPEIRSLISDLDDTRWTGRPGYPVRTIVGAVLVKSVYALPTWTRTSRLMAEHAALRQVIGGAPSHSACYRFAAKPREHEAVLTACTDRVLADCTPRTRRWARRSPSTGRTCPLTRMAISTSETRTARCGPVRGPRRRMGHRSSISTRKGGAFYGYKLHMAICTQTELPLAWTVHAANEAEQGEVAGLLDSVMERGFAAQVAVMDKGYDGQPMHGVCEARDIRPVIALMETAAVKAGEAQAPRRATTGRGRSPGPMPGAARPSGAARPASARPRQCGSRRRGCTR
jgi:hypothetical protein